MGAGAKLWEKTHSKQVKKEQELSGPIEYDTYEGKKEGFTKTSTPAGQDRNISKEDTTKRRKSLDDEIEKATQ